MNKKETYNNVVKVLVSSFDTEIKLLAKRNCGTGINLLFGGKHEHAAVDDFSSFSLYLMSTKENTAVNKPVVQKEVSSLRKGTVQTKQRTTTRRASQAVPTSQQKAPPKRQIPASARKPNPPPQTEGKTRDQLLAEWKAKKGKKTTSNTSTYKTITKTNSARPQSTAAAIKNSPAKQSMKMLLKMRLKNAKEVAMNATPKHYKLAQEKLLAMSERDPLLYFMAIEKEQNCTKRFHMEKQLQTLIDQHAMLFSLSDYWTSRAFVAHSSGDLESAVILLQLADKLKAQPLHPILESIQYLLKLVKKETSLLFTNPISSLFVHDTAPLLGTLQRLQRLSMISANRQEKLKELAKQLANFSFVADDLLILSPVMGTKPLVNRTQHENMVPASVINQEHNVFVEEEENEVLPVAAAISYQEPSEEGEEEEEEVCEFDYEDTAESSKVVITAISPREIRRANVPPEVVILINGSDKIPENINGTFNCTNESPCDSENAHFQHLYVEEESDSSEIILELSSDEEEEEILLTCDEKMERMGEEEEGEEEDDVTESESIEIEFSESEDDDEGTAFDLRLTDDTTTSPRRFREIVRTPQAHTGRGDFTSPELLPNPVPISEMLCMDLGEDPMSPAMCGASQKTKKPVNARVTPKRDQSSTPGRVNTPLMQKIRERGKKRSSIFAPSPSPFLRSAEPARVDPSVFHREMKKQAKTIEAVDALALYRRESVLYKASVNDMVNDLFADEELFDDFPTSAAFHTPTPPNSPHRREQLAHTPLQSRIKVAEIPDRMVTLLEEKQMKKEKSVSVTPHGSVVVMTPIRTTKKEQKEFNSEQKLTNVRRSVRKHKDSLCTPSKQDHTDMLQYCNYSYQANETLHHPEREPLMILSETLEGMKITNEEQETTKQRRRRKGNKT